MSLRSFVIAVAASLVLSAAPTASADPIPLPTSPLGDAPGTNDWDCDPSAARPSPVILVHGTFGDRRNLLEQLATALVADGYCVFALDYGNRATGDIAESAEQLRVFTRRVRNATGARKVSLVGHSQGGMMPRYFIRFLGGRKVVDDLVGIAPSNHGSTLFGGGNELTGTLVGTACTSCMQQAADSEFMTRLNAGDETPGQVSYTQITTAYDELVQPHTSGYLAEGPRTTNVTVQDLCPSDPAEHVLIPMSRTTIAVTLNALGRRGPASKSFRPTC